GGQRVVHPRVAGRGDRALRDADGRGLDRLADVDVGMPGDQDVVVVERVDDAGFLAAGDEVVDQHAQPAVGSGAELGDRAGKVVDAVQRLHDDSFDPQVVTPDALDELDRKSTRLN